MAKERLWWMVDSPTYNLKRWDADVVFFLLMFKTPVEEMTDFEKMHYQEFLISYGRK